MSPAHDGAPAWTAGAASRIGSTRATNMDACLALPEHGVVVLADGMGSTPRGRDAAWLAVHSFARGVMNAAREIPAVQQVVEQVQQQVVDEFGGRVLTGATTLCAAVVAGNAVLVVNVGDSRCYRLRGDRLELLTADHTVAAHLVAVGAAEPGSPLVRRTTNHLRRYLGNPAGATADITSHDVTSADVLLLSSDGLHHNLTQAQLFDILAAHRGAEEAAQALVTAAAATDDATAVVMRPLA